MEDTQDLITEKGPKDFDKSISEGSQVGVQVANFIDCGDYADSCKYNTFPNSNLHTAGNPNHTTNLEGKNGEIEDNAAGCDF